MMSTHAHTLRVFRCCRAPLSVAVLTHAHASIIPLLLTHPSSESGATPDALESLRSWEAAIRGGMYKYITQCVCMYVFICAMACTNMSWNVCVSTYKCVNALWRIILSPKSAGIV